MSALTEAGVGLDAADPNAPYAGVPVITGSITATDASGLFFSVAQASGVVHRADGTLDEARSDAWTAAGGGASVTTSYGVFTVDAEGHIRYELNQTANSPADALSAGDTVTEIITVKVQDANGNASTVDVTFTLHGTNDRPEITTAGWA